jgi:hypothetical protein
VVGEADRGVVGAAPARKSELLEYCKGSPNAGGGGLRLRMALARAIRRGCIRVVQRPLANHFLAADD